MTKFALRRLGALSTSRPGGAFLSCISAVPGLRVSGQILIWLINVLASCAALADTSAQSQYERVLLAEPDMTRGAALYDICAACHGPTGSGARDGSVPAISAQHFKVIARQLVDFQHADRTDERMEHFADSHHLTDAQQIADVAAYINALAASKAIDSPQRQEAAEGARVYERQCASCHGREAQGSGTLAIPRLAGQQYGYLLQQMHDILEGRRQDYSPEHKVLFNRLHDSQFVSISHYLAQVPVVSP